MVFIYKSILEYGLLYICKIHYKKVERLSNVINIYMEYNCLDICVVSLD